MKTSNKKYVSSVRVCEPCLMSGTPTVYELNHGSILRPATECRGIASDPPCWPCRGGGAQPRPTIAARRQGTAAPRTGLCRRRSVAPDLFLTRVLPTTEQKQASSLGTHLSCEILSEFRQSSCSQNQSLHICYDPVMGTCCDAGELNSGYEAVRICRKEKDRGPRKTESCCKSVTARVQASQHDHSIRS